MTKAIKISDYYKYKFGYVIIKDDIKNEIYLGIKKVKYYTNY